MIRPKDFMVEITAKPVEAGEDFRMKIATTLTCVADGEALRKALDILLPLLPAEAPPTDTGSVT